ncbi:alanine racemase [Sulfurifustis variabilis]|uniref:Pyridoxal phosphate homeostasis protein n=1 Tax=Sulfurifustis variabilis TaxID=1675686 RepID=A0A1B4V4K4_9GAMM|nr:YggS family pyridoxal phosphate-dependent enzyme [Sulfurifustis variabilis]BAU48460.1 alanine racemase [Sulfurifustis variabilis]
MDGARDISSRLAALRDRIAELARAAGRDPRDVRLIAVSKTHPAESVRDALDAGQRDFGESTVQEALPKIDALSGTGAQWHFIGHLQSNKAKFILPRFAWVHSLDSAKIAVRLSHVAHEWSTPLNALIEVNVTRDPAKHGVLPEALPGLLEQLRREDLPGIVLRGLMTIGPHQASEPEIRCCFAGLRQLRDENRARFGLPLFTELSMGMSGDYAYAIAEGATMVRLGTAIFGERSYARAAKAGAPG